MATASVPRLGLAQVGAVTLSVEAVVVEHEQRCTYVAPREGAAAPVVGAGYGAPSGAPSMPTGGGYGAATVVSGGYGAPQFDPNAAAQAAALAAQSIAALMMPEGLAPAPVMAPLQPPVAVDRLAAMRAQLGLNKAPEQAAPAAPVTDPAANGAGAMDVDEV